jgi:hypothetical protein
MEQKTRWITVKMTTTETVCEFVILEFKEDVLCDRGIRHKGKERSGNPVIPMCP